MSLELTMLVWSIALTFVQMVIAASAATLQLGAPRKTGNGNGDDAGEVTGWVARARRAHLDMLANMVLFAPLIVIADIAGRDNKMTEIGAQLFFWTRLAYAIVYIVGVPRLRTAVWSASAVAMVLIFVQLV
jgi:uncharacterized MAPEG superfamily protein